jgi:alpha,alpha-trehalose phosphorylase
MRDFADHLEFRPQLPPGWHRLRFSVRPRGARLHVEITPGRVSYLVEGDGPLPITHRSGGRSDEITLRPGKSVTRRWRPVKPQTPRPSQPPGREPATIAGG